MATTNQQLSSKLYDILLMRTDSDKSKDQRDIPGQPSRDRLDWISKYLELADRIIENHAPELVRNNGKA